MYKVSFLTAKGYNDSGDDLVIKYADQISKSTSPSLQISKNVWDDKTQDWKSFDLIVVRSCWDYHLRYDEFRNWIIKHQDLPIQNAPSLLLWNMNKKYLLELQKLGVPVPPTWILLPGEITKIDETVSSIRNLGLKKVVVKPAVSASAHKTKLVPIEDLDKVLHDLLKVNVGDQSISTDPSSNGWIVQDFLSEVQDEGEWSLIFIDGKFLFGVVKVPAKGDFRVQTGNKRTEEKVDEKLISTANQVLETIKKIDNVDKSPLYARVDMVRRKDGEVVLMELELIEPSLYLSVAPKDAPKEVYDAMLKTVLKNKVQ